MARRCMLQSRALHRTIYGDGRTKYGAVPVSAVAALYGSTAIMFI